jgi:D-alanyl-lipoteichoic acid acyltransferase DltB (MBOAT superfamily)
MLFNSLSFLIFFPIVTLVFFALKHKYRWLWLLLASSFFYMFFKPVYILILAFTIIVDYFVGVELEKTSNARTKKILLITSIAGNILVLAIFKYYNFINENITDVLTVFDIHNSIPYLKILLPIGLSFHTFQAMSYIIEVYRGNQKAEKHFGYYALYVMFYPQLVAGPIERPQNILHQFHEKKTFNMDMFSLGLKMIIFGLFKKAVIADNIAPIVNNIYSNHTSDGLACLVAMFLFSIQIYCDFSGYSDIALGTAKCMGYDLMKNFALPYHSKSVTEFWRKWHISLSSWFRDYVYIPLGGSASGNYKGFFNLSIVFLISGLWHGANWNYILWGGLHAVILILEKLFLLRFYKKLPNVLLITINFCVITVCWLLFRIENFQTLTQILHALTAIPANLSLAKLHTTLVLLGNLKFIVLALLIVCFLLIDKYFDDEIYQNALSKKRNIVQKYQYHILTTVILIFGFVGEIQFIYFQF